MNGTINLKSKLAGASALVGRLRGSVTMSNTIINGGASPYPKHVGPAAICSFSDGAQDAPLKSLKFYISPNQDLHGYSYPWPDAGNINKLPSPTATSKTVNGITIAVNNGVYSISGTATAQAEIIFDLPSTVTYNTSWKTCFLNDAINAGVVFYYRLNNTNGTSMGFSNSTNRVLEHTYEQSANKVRFLVSNGTAISGTLHVSPMLMLKTEATPTSFSPYSNICPISGWSQVDAWQTGFNAWDEEWEVGGYSSSTGNKITQNNTIRSKNQFAVAPNTAYYFSAPYSIVDYGIWLFFYDSAGVYHKSYQHIYNASFTTPQDAAYMTFELAATYGTTYNNDVSVNHPATDHSYHAYNGAKTEFSLGRTIGEGYLKPLTGQLHESKRLMNLSDLTWQYNATYHIGYTYVPGKANGRTNFITSICKTVDKGYATMVNGEAAGVTGDNGLNIRLDSTTDKDSFLAAIADETILFDLATPQEYSLTPVSVSSLLGQNNIWCNTGDTELDYYPAAASVVAVLNKSSRVYTSIPLGKIRYDTYQTTPNQALDLDSYRAETGVLIRNVLSHTATKIEFNTPSMTNLQWEEVWNIIKAGFNNSTERKLKLKYYDQMSATYKTGWFYVPDVNFTIRNIDEATGIINYDEIRVAFIEY